MQQPLALIGIQGTIFSEHEVFRVYDFEIVFIFTRSIFFKKCENNESTGACTTEYHSTTEYQFFYLSYKILRKRAIYFIFVNIY